jgi:uncharacterized protein YjiS (DUF1127 family)
MIEKITNIRFTYQSARTIFGPVSSNRMDDQACRGGSAAKGVEFARFVRDLEAVMIAILSYSMIAVAAFRRALAAVGGRLSRIGRALKNRRAATALAGLDDHMLADIGITRSDLRDAYSEPLWHDPTDVLVGRVAERRQRRRSALVRSDNDPPAWIACRAACQ